jgi:hypothetical protein
MCFNDYTPPRVGWSGSVGFRGYSTLAVYGEGATA